MLTPGREVPGDRLLYAFYDRFGETIPFIALARAAARVMRGRSAEETRRAGKSAAAQLVDLVQPYALEALAEHRRAGRSLVLATTTPIDLIDALAVLLGFDAVVATRYEIEDGHYTGRLDGRFVWGAGKRAAVQRWASEQQVDLAASHAYSDSVFDMPLLTLVGHPHPLNADPRLGAFALARRWPLEYWDRAPASRRFSGSSPTISSGPSSGPRAFPTPASTSTGSTTFRRAARSCWPPTTGATSTWPHWLSWPPAFVAPSGSWANKSCSTHR